VQKDKEKCIKLPLTYVLLLLLVLLVLVVLAVVVLMVLLVVVVLLLLLLLYFLLPQLLGLVMRIAVLDFAPPAFFSSPRPMNGAISVS
jgi:hypothetical protein